MPTLLTHIVHFLSNLFDGLQSVRSGAARANSYVIMAVEDQPHSSILETLLPFDSNENSMIMKKSSN